MLPSNGGNPLKKVPPSYNISMHLTKLYGWSTQKFVSWRQPFNNTWYNLIVDIYTTSGQRKPQTRWVENTRLLNPGFKHYQSAGFNPLKLHEVKLIEISNYIPLISRGKSYLYLLVNNAVKILMEILIDRKQGWYSSQVVIIIRHIKKGLIMTTSTQTNR